MGTREIDSQTDPTPAELVAIDQEWPLIAAELDLLDAEILILSAVGGPSPLDWRRLRRAEQRVMRAAAAIGSPVVPTRLAA
ncbi:DUF6284 family protein [Plantactinospora veratri]|uniref:DUF6284 family protein n=1 Tax=Plantactinospora veratri TaxID=1436122 RepID=A0ABU7SKJ6_9ACTN